MPLILTGTSASTTLDSSAGLTFSDSSNQSAAASPFGLKNRIINGDMVIDQRNNGASVTPANGAYTLDRWGVNQFATSSRFSVQQNAGSVTPPTGFNNYLGVTSLSAYSVAVGDIYSIYQRIEGFNVADLGWGAANASTVTLSFWVRSSLTGTFGGAFQNEAGDRAYPFTYTISSANTWTRISITIPGDTTGTWLKTNGNGLQITFGLGVGSNRSATAGSWQAGNFGSATGATSVVGTNGATWYLTGVQLERNTTATPFEWIPYGQELMLCQRYFQTYSPPPLRGVVASGTAWSRAGMVLPVVMRATPTVAIPAALPFFDGTNVGTSSNIITNFSTTTVVELDLTATTGTLTGGRPLIAYQGVGGQLTVSAEL
jgi:hypothetical protein